MLKLEILHEASIRDNEEICKLKHELNSTQDCLKDAQEALQESKIQNEQLLEELQSSRSPSYVSDFCMDDSRETPHGVVNHEIQTDLQMFEGLKDEQAEWQTLAMDEEEHELSHSASLALVEEAHDPTHMEPALRRGFQFSDLEDELVHYTSSYTVTSFSFHPSEVWVKGFFLLVPHEEYETPTLHDDPMICAPIPFEQHLHPLFCITSTHGCTSLSHLEAPSLIDGGSSSIAWIREHMMRHLDTSYSFLQHYETWNPHLCYWIRFDWYLHDCVLLTHDDFLDWRCKLLECSLMDDHFSHIGSGISLYHFTMFHYDVSILVLMMYGRMHSRTWDPGTPPHDVLFCTTLCIDGMRQLWDPGIPHLVGIIRRTLYPSYFDVLFWENFCMIEMHKHWDMGIPHSDLYVFTLYIDGVHKCWDPGIPYLLDLFLMTLSILFGHWEHIFFGWIE